VCQQKITTVMLAFAVSAQTKVSKRCGLGRV
jgi:hypothetical protein